MTVTVDLPPGVEQAYLAAAQARGVPLVDLVREVVIASQPVGPTSTLTPEEWVHDFKAWAHSHDEDNLPLLSDEEISRDSIYD
jgi:hypothetical protein